MGLLPSVDLECVAQTPAASNTSQVFTEQLYGFCQKATSTKPRRLNFKGSGDDVLQPQRSYLSDVQISDGTSYKTTRRHRASPGEPLGACCFNCCLQTPDTVFCFHQRNHTLYFMKFLFNVFPSLLPLLFLPILTPHLQLPLLPFKMRHQTDKKDFFLPCFQLNFLPAWKHSSISLVLPLLTSLLYVPGATT